MLSDTEINGWWDIARPGKWDGSMGGEMKEIPITLKELQGIAADYDPELQQAPVTVEHDQSGPALGWVAELRMKGEVLQARLKDISDTMMEWLRSKAYNSRSIESYTKFKPTGRPYLGALTFLGAAAPAVKGLATVPELFAEHGQPDTWVDYKEEVPDPKFTERMKVWFKEFLSEQGSSLINTQEKSNMADEKDYKALYEKEETARIALENQLSETSAKFNETEKTLVGLQEAEAKRTKASEMATFTEGIEQAAKDNKITPADKTQYIELAEDMDDEHRGKLLEKLQARNPDPKIAALFAEATPKEDAEKKSTGRMAKDRKFVEDSIASMGDTATDENKADAEHTIACFNLMEETGNENMTHPEASGRIRASK